MADLFDDALRLAHDTYGLELLIGAPDDWAPDDPPDLLGSVLSSLAAGLKAIYGHGADAWAAAAAVNDEPASIGGRETRSYAEAAVRIAQDRQYALLLAINVVEARKSAIGVMSEPSAAEVWQNRRAIAENFRGLAPVNFSSLQVRIEKEGQRASKAELHNQPERTNQRGCMNENISHTSDFRSVNWHGESIAFTSNQAAIVKLLWPQLSDGGEIGGHSLLEDAGIYSARIDHVFRGSPAWGRMIVPGETKGAYRLADESQPLPDLKAKNFRRGAKKHR